MSEYKIFMGKDQMDLWNALLADHFKSTDETRARLKELSDKSEKESLEDHNRRKVYFIEEYGLELFNFIASISKPNFLAYKGIFSFSWTISSDENDDYYVVEFWKGKFDYVMEICGGYAGKETLEADISKERVLELLKTKP